MENQRLETIQAAIDAGKWREARRMLAPLAKDNPSADVWVLLAHVADTKQQALRCLEKALDQDALHSQANRMHMALVNAGHQPRPKHRSKLDSAPVDPTLTRGKVEPLKPVRRTSRRGTFLPLLLLGLLLLSLSSTLLVLNLLGAAPEVTNVVARSFGGPTPITMIDGVSLRDVRDPSLATPAPTVGFVDGVPVSELRNPAAVVPAARSVSLQRGSQGADGDMLRAGQLHEYLFQGNRGEELGVGIQFFSPLAQNVAPNVVVIDPSGDVADRSRCQPQIIIDARTGTAFLCRIHESGTWRLRVFGSANESVGVYVVTVARVGDPVDFDP